MKFIPSTGVTLPLVSYGVSSVVSTLIMFGIIQGICVLENSGVDKNVRQKKAVQSGWAEQEVTERPQYRDEDEKKQNRQQKSEQDRRGSEKKSRRYADRKKQPDTDEFWGE